MSASGGEYIGRCLPNAHVISGLDLWYVVEFEFDEKPAAVSDAMRQGDLLAVHSRILTRKLHELQSILITKGILASCERAEKHVWAFARSISQLDALFDAEAVPLALHDGTCPVVTHRGQLVTADLLRDAHGATMQTFKPSQASQNAALVDPVSLAALRGNEVAAKRYRLLMLAILESFSFRLSAFDDKFSPVAFGLLAERPSETNGSSGERRVSKDDLRSKLIRLSPVLTSHGSLIMSTSRAPNPDLYRVTAATSPGPIYIGPCGSWVYLLSGRYDEYEGYQPAVEDAFRGEDGMIWRSKVQEFLARKGVTGPDPNDRDGWAAIQISPTSRLRIAWPVDLCHAWGLDNDRKPDDEAWRRCYDTNATKDSFDAALDWLWDHQGADSIMNTDAMQVDDEEIASDFSFTIGGAVQSPTSARQTQYHDLNASMIYPTPPDGMPLHAPSEFSQEAYLDSSTQEDSGLTQGGMAEPNNLDTQAGTQEDPDLGASPNYADDLFGDGSDIPDEPDVTDADFSFFDEKSLVNAIDATMTDFGESQNDLFENLPLRPDENEVIEEIEEVSVDSMHMDATTTISEKHVSFGKEADPMDEAADGPTQAGSSAAPDGDFRADTQKSQSTSETFVSLSDTSPTTDAYTSMTSRPFNPVAFNAGMMQSDSKYSGQGRFAMLPAKSIDKEARGKLLSSMSAHRESGPSSSWKPRARTVPSRSRKEYMSQQSSSSEDDSMSSSDEEFSGITDDDESYDETDPQRPVTVRPRSTKNDHSHATFLDETASGQTPEQIDNITSALLFDYFDGYKTNAPTQPPADMLKMGNKRLQFASRHIDDSTTGLQEFAIIAQTVARFAGNTTQLGDPVDGDFGQGSAIYSQSVNRLRPALTSTVEAIFGELGLTEDLASYAVLDPTPILSSPRLGAPSPGAQSGLLGEAIFEIPAPYVKVSKTGDSWCLASSSIPFWDVLGLGPLHGNKDVVAHCVVPGTGRLIQAAQDFLHAAKSSYESTRLGQHHIGGMVTEFQNNGVVPSRALNIRNESEALGQIEETCSLLANVLSRKGAQDDTLLVYIVNPFTSPEAFAALCRCCAILERRYHEGIGQVGLHSNIVSIIVPNCLISTDDAPVFIASESMAVFTRNVYDRILPPLSKRSLAISTANAIELEEAARTRIPFEISEKASADPLLEGSCMHLAYIASADSRWVTAAWIDDTGTCQDASAFCLEGRTFAEAVYEIWLATIEIIRTRKVSWRLFLTSAAPMSIQEQKLWLRLATMLGSPQAPVRATLTLLSVNVSPSLELSVPVAPTEGNMTSQGVGGLSSYMTPASTPGPLASSPHPTPPSMNVGTPTSEAVQPAADADPSARLVDATDESWGIILSHPLTALADPLTYAPARCSGYLAKRCSVDEQEAPVLMEVNLIYCADKIEPGESALIRNDKTLRQVLVSYRGLNLLARLRGVQGSDSTVPWHVAVARRGAEALTKGMVSPGTQS